MFFYPPVLWPLGIPLIQRLLKLPYFVRLEASTLCQLNCRTCYMRLNNFGSVGKGYLKFSDFKNFIDKHAYIKVIELANSGEIFLNPDLIKIMEYAFERNVRLTALGGVNFNTITNEMIEALVKYRFYSMAISIDGASQEVYSLYRRNGDYDKVIENIKKLNELKRKYNSRLPKLVWQYIIMGHNEDDVISAKKQAKQLNMDIFFKMTWDKDYKPSKIKMLHAETKLPFLTMEEEASNNPTKLSAYSLICRQLWICPQINWDGRLLGCCNLFKDDFGINVFEEGLEKAINSDNFKYAKQLLQGKVPPSPHYKNIPCVSCSDYKQMVENNSFLKI